jgi:ferrous iron transport protein B
MSARTIKNKRQRRMTVLLTPFVPCGAKLPVIALFVTVFFTGYSYITAIVYFMAIAIIFLVGYIIKAITYADFKNQEDTYLVIELPEYKLPSLTRALKVMLDQGWEFIKKAATIIILMNAVIWLLTNFDFSFELVENTSDSMLRFISEPFAWILIPLGFGIWGLAAAAVAGFVAKEEVVGALAVIFAFSLSDDFEVAGIEATRNILMTTGGLTAVSAFAYMAFNLFTPPCFAAIGAMNAELDSKKWTVFAVALQLAIGYVVALVIYQVGTLIFYQELGQGFYASIIIFIAFIIGFLYLKFLAKNGKGLASIG